MKLQTKDRRSQPVLITIFPNEQMMVVLDKYVLKSGVNKEKVKFFFDGEELDENQTAEEVICTVVYATKSKLVSQVTNHFFLNP